VSIRESSDVTPTRAGMPWYLKLYPREWRARYGDELIELVGDRALSIGTAVNLIAGAIDARFTTEKKMPSILRTACLTRNDLTTTADGMRAAAVMIISSLAFLGAGMVANRSGWHQTSEFLKGLSFPFSLALMSHYLYLRKQSPIAKWIITGGTIAFLFIISVVATKL
jgi:hypothetical protein